MTTVYNDIASALRSRVANNIASIDADFTAADVAWAGGTLALAGKDEWMRVTILFEAAAQADMTGTRRVEGTLALDFFSRPRAGTDGQPVDAELAVAQMMDAARDLFPLGQTVTAGSDTVRFREPTPVPVFDEDGMYSAAGLRCDWYLHT